jgi:hypothetical protein
MDSIMHLALISLPIRALFVPIGFQSIRIDPNILFEAIENVKTEKNIDVNTDNADTKQKEFYYFSESVTESKGIEAKIIDENEKILLSEMKTDISEQQNEEVISNLLRNSKNISAEILGMNNVNLQNQNEENDKISILPVCYDNNTKTIITKGLYF